MKTDELINAITGFSRILSPMPVYIQLPDNEPPVDFTAVVIDGTVILFPKVPEEYGEGDWVWDHDHNYNGAILREHVK